MIRGGVTSVTPGVSTSYALTEDGNETTVLDFGDERADVDTYHLTVEVRDVIAHGPSVAVGATVQVGIALPPDIDPDEVVSDYERVDDAVFFVQESPVFDYDPALLAITEDGTFMGLVDDTTVTYPLMEVPDAFTADGADLASLRSAAGSARR